MSFVDKQTPIVDRQMSLFDRQISFVGKQISFVYRIMTFFESRILFIERKIAFGFSSSTKTAWSKVPNFLKTKSSPPFYGGVALKAPGWFLHLFFFKC